jgi:hypothetical protein
LTLAVFYLARPQAPKFGAPLMPLSPGRHRLRCGLLFAQCLSAFKIISRGAFKL